MILDPCLHPITITDKKVIGIDNRLLGCSPIFTILEFKIFINLCRHIKLNALKVPLNRVLDIFLMNKIGTSCMANITTYFSKYENFYVLSISNKVVSSSTFVSNFLKYKVY